MPKITLKKPEYIEVEEPEYEVVYQGVQMFTHSSYSLCNSYIFTRGLQGVRPKLMK